MMARSPLRPGVSAMRMTLAAAFLARSTCVAKRERRRAERSCPDAQPPRGGSACGARRDARRAEHERLRDMPPGAVDDNARALWHSDRGAVSRAGKLAGKLVY